MRSFAAVLVVVAVLTSGCGAAGSRPEPSAVSSGGSGSDAPPSHTADQSGDPEASVTPFPPVLATPAGILPPGSVARVTAKGLRVRSGPSGSPDHEEVLYSLSPGDLVLIGSSPLSYVPPESTPDGRGWYEVHVGGAEAMSHADGGINGWVAEGEHGLEWLAAEALTCRGAGTLAGVLTPPDQGGATHEWATAWDQLACYGGDQLHLDGVIDYLCFEGSMLPFDMVPYHLAAPVWCTGLIPDDGADLQATGVSLGLRFGPEWGAFPRRGDLVQIAGHFDDPASSTCTIRNPAGDGLLPRFDSEFLVLFCRERFVVDELTVVGHRALAPLPWE